jgi:chemotaxis protein CheD
MSKLEHATPLWNDRDYSDESEVRRRYFDSKLKKTVVRVLQGDFYVSSDPREVLTTILGSCIAVCMRDPVIGCGGMNHFVLPSSSRDLDSLPSAQLRYGSYSIERMTNAILSRGGRRDRLEIKVFGGANVLGRSNVGHENADFVEAYLRKEEMAVAAQHLRGSSPRRVRYNPTSGQAFMAEALASLTAQIAAREAQLRDKTVATNDQNSVELF